MNILHNTTGNPVHIIVDNLIGDKSGLLHISDNQTYEIENQRSSSFPLQVNMIVENNSLVKLPSDVHIYGLHCISSTNFYNIAFL